MPRILIADDEEAMRGLVARALMLDGHETVTAEDGAEVLDILSRDNGADYRIYVESKTFTVQDAAALVVSAHQAPARLAAASL